MVYSKFVFLYLFILSEVGFFTGYFFMEVPRRKDLPRSTLQTGKKYYIPTFCIVRYYYTLFCFEYQVTEMILNLASPIPTGLLITALQRRKAPSYIDVSAIHSSAY